MNRLSPKQLEIRTRESRILALARPMGLIGVAINDSIVGLAALKEQHPHGFASRSDIVDLVIRCTRHVVATTLTTIAGFAPLILGGGEFWPPLAIAIAGGVSGATLLAICFVPAVYLMLSGPCRDSAAPITCDGSAGRANQTPFEVNSPQIADNAVGV